MTEQREMPRCETCKWWQLDTAWISKRDMRPCFRLRDSQLWSSPALVVYGGVAREIQTRKDFGCTLHEAREEKG